VIEDVLEAAVANQCVKESTPRTLIQNLPGGTTDCASTGCQKGLEACLRLSETGSP
jgi:hypothetical protein